MEAYLSAAKEASSEFCEKKSVFIGYAKPTQTEDDARDFIEKIRSKHADATHNVFAYVLENLSVVRFSDDGEPSGTAGVPVLDVMKKEGLSFTTVVVTRYFGGILLGAGGLVRAYSKAAKLALDASGIAEFVPYFVFDVTLSYSDNEKLAPGMKILDASLENVEYSDSVRSRVLVGKADEQNFRKFVADISCGRGKTELLGEKYSPRMKIR